jgi:hypothetical protein
VVLGAGRRGSGQISVRAGGGDGRGSVLGLLGFDLGAPLWAMGCRGAGTPAAGGGGRRGCQFPTRGGSGEKEASQRAVVGARGDGRRASWGFRPAGP